jgi:hypothetical protein
VVHVVDQLRQPRRDPGPHAHRLVHRDRPRSTGTFLVAEPVAAAVGVLAVAALDPRVPEAAADVVLPHPAQPANPQAPQQEVHT